MTLDRQPRYPLARTPTPLHEAKRLRAALGGEGRCPRILLKRDDLTDLALGGNKARKLEFLLGDALAQGATALVTTGGVQSNHARMTAAAAALTGLRCALVLSATNRPAGAQGNLLLDTLLGADIHFVTAADTKGDASPDDAEAERVEDVMHALRDEGEQPYLVTLGGSDGVGVLGYVEASRELDDQLRQTRVRATRVYYASGSRGTQAGLELGARIFGADWKPVGIAVSPGGAEKQLKAARIAADAADRIGVPHRLDPADLTTDEAHFGEGYAIPTTAGAHAIRLLARTEAIFLDPVYTGKALAGMLAHIAAGEVPPDETIVFLHTGGVPGLFAQATTVLAMAGKETGT
jgi:D-cysteine desulfhydrase family pyridoxal phosphate-dependent enzyme